MRDSVTLDKPFNRSYTVLGLSWGSCISGAHSKKTSLWQLGRQYCKFWITLDKILKIALGFSCSRRTKQPWRNTSEADNKVNIITVLMRDFKEVDIHVFCGPTRARYQIKVAVLVSTFPHRRRSGPVSRSFTGWCHNGRSSAGWCWESNGWPSRGSAPSARWLQSRTWASGGRRRWAWQMMM